jgi:TrmH family RNA methyltransferase
MSFVKEIQSPQNARFKFWVQMLEKNRNRKKEGFFILEGFKELELALKSGYTIKELIYCPEFTSPEKIDDFIDSLSVSNPIWEQIEVTHSLFKEIAYRSEIENVLAVIEQKNHRIEEFELNPNGVYLAVESVEKPGNLGAILRSADACGVDGVLICDERVDIYHPNVLRNSLGCALSVKVGVGNNESIWKKMEQAKLNVYTTFMENSTSVFETDIHKGCVLLVGTEHEGVSDFWRGKGNNINIPMMGLIDSLNVSVAASIIMYESLRQRKSSN